MKQYSSSKEIPMWQKIGGILGFLAILTLIIMVFQLMQDRKVAESQSNAQATQIALIKEQLDLSREIATIKAGADTSPESATIAAVRVSQLEATSIALSTGQAQDLRSSTTLCFGNCWQYDTSARTMTWIGLSDGTEDIWQASNESLQKIRSGYSAIITTSVPGEIMACVLNVNGQSVMSSCGLYKISSGTYQIKSANNNVGGFRWCPALGYGWRANGGECK
jgi:hypothetical protein